MDWQQLQAIRKKLTLTSSNPIKISKKLFYFFHCCCCCFELALLWHQWINIGWLKQDLTKNSFKMWRLNLIISWKQTILKFINIFSQEFTLIFFLIFQNYPTVMYMVSNGNVHGKQKAGTKTLVLVLWIKQIEKPCQSKLLTHQVERSA